MFPFKSPPLSGGDRPPVIQNFTAGQTATGITPPLGAKKLIAELLSGGAPGFIGADEDENGNPDEAGSGAGGHYLRVSFQLGAGQSFELSVAALKAAEFEQAAYGNNSYIYMYTYGVSSGYLAFCNAPANAYASNGGYSTSIEGVVVEQFTRGSNGATTDINSGADDPRSGGAAASGGSLVGGVGGAPGEAGSGPGGGGGYAPGDPGSGAGGYIRLTWTF
ncbi:hypothetical protein J2X45_003409 [Caulobacter sp. BE264]|uniref:hypothetical protein n=1 Tax=Caulobacter sp. BE264 TaxID=2817724 RepID=UPI00286272CF|nr:hypothetical protein [Caulobacter sp. BE264]MDR7232303.1 hypothetical protein [Caulobacter sp. BE264]